MQLHEWEPLQSWFKPSSCIIFKALAQQKGERWRSIFTAPVSVASSSRSHFVRCMNRLSEKERDKMCCFQPPHGKINCEQVLRKCLTFPKGIKCSHIFGLTQPSKLAPLRLTERVSERESEQRGSRASWKEESENKAVNQKNTNAFPDGFMAITFWSTNKHIHTSSPTGREVPHYDWMQPEARSILLWPVSDSVLV